MPNKHENIKNAEEQPRPKGINISRRQVLAGAASLVAITAAGQVLAQGQPGDETSRVMGAGADELGERSSHEALARMPIADYPHGSLASFAPLGELDGTITPSDLHFEVHHAGIPEIDPDNYQLLVHGLVERPTMFSLADLKRFPSVTRLGFLECAGNSLGHYLEPTEEDTAQTVAGLASNSEWVGVPLTTIFDEVGVNPEATWVLFEGADAALMIRSWPIEALWHSEAMLAYGQNGEALRPPQGYPLRLYVPGSEGNANVKWLRRIEFSDQPVHSQKETSEYSDVRCGPDGECVVNQFTFTMDAKSVITWPSGGQSIPAPGLWEIRGLAWSGRGPIEAVEVSTDGGQSWHASTLDQPVLPKAFTRFRYVWDWDGQEAVIMSRARDSTGYVQPTLQELIDWRGEQITYYHLNEIFRWQVTGDGSVISGDVV